MGTKYSTNSASGYNATPPADDGTVSEANKTKWSTVKTKLADPVKDLADTINSELVTHFNNGPTAITSNTTLDGTHYNKIIQVSGVGVTLTLTDAATLTAGWYCDIISTDASNNVTLARATASNTINETSADVTILPLQALRLIVNAAANGFLVDLSPRHSKAFKLSNDVTLSGGLTMSGKSITYANASIAAHATTMDPWSLGNYGTLTGSAVTFTDIAAAPQAGAEVELYMNAAHTFTDGAVFEVDGDANWTAAIGSRVLIRAKSTTLFTVHPRNKDGTAIVSSGLSAATQAEQEAGSSTTVATTPGRQQYHPSAAKAWVSFNGTGTPAINLAYNVGSITDNGVGDYTINFTTAFSTANYAGSFAVNYQSAGTYQRTAQIFDATQAGTDPTGSAVRIRCIDENGQVAFDPKYVWAAFFGDQ